jgi:hypothetical protein
MVVAFMRRSEESLDDFRFGGAVSGGEFAQFFDVTIHVASIGGVQGSTVQ